MLQTCNSHRMKAEKQSYSFWFRSVVLDIFWFEISKNFDVRRKPAKTPIRPDTSLGSESSFPPKWLVVNELNVLANVMLTL